jgi:hypothetical protein
LPPGEGGKKSIGGRLYTEEREVGEIDAWPIGDVRVCPSRWEGIMTLSPFCRVELGAEVLVVEEEITEEEVEPVDTVEWTEELEELGTRRKLTDARRTGGGECEGGEESVMERKLNEELPWGVRGIVGSTG